MNFNVGKLNADLFWREPVEVVSKPLRGPNLGVGEAFNPKTTKCIQMFKRLTPP